MKIAKGDAVRLFVALGLKNADKWNDQRMASKLAKIKEMVDEDVKLEPDEQDLLNKVMAAAGANEEFEITADEVKTEVKDVEVESATEETADTTDEAKEKPKKEPKPKADKKSKETKNVRPSATVSYYCGQVFREFGLDKGVTDEMVARLDQLRNKQNPDDAAAHLAYSWHVVNGFTQKVPV